MFKKLKKKKKTLLCVAAALAVMLSAGVALAQTGQDIPWMLIILGLTAVGSGTYYARSRKKAKADSLF